MEHYRSQLRHVVQPEAPRERREADRLQLAGWEALWLRERLVEYGHYEAADAEAEIALAWAEWIVQEVESDSTTNVTLYAHTFDAKEVFYDVLQAVDGEPQSLDTSIALDLDARCDW